MWSKGLVDLGRPFLSCSSNNFIFLAVEHKQFGIVAIDAAGCSQGADEKYEPSVVAAFQEAKARGVHRTVHAGEAGGARSVIRGVEEMSTEVAFC